MKFKNKYWALRLLPLLAVAASLVAQIPALAQTLTALQVRSLAASCAACHGTDGQAQPGMISLAAVPQEVTAQKMRDFKAGRVPAATVMHQLAKGYADNEINAIAAYFAAQKK
jgi:cytochrome c553